MREKEKMLTLVGHKRDKKQSKNKGKSKKKLSAEEDNAHVTKKRLYDKGTADDSGPDSKKIRIEIDETAGAFSEEEIACPEESAADVQAAAIEQKIETRILEDVEYVFGGKE